VTHFQAPADKKFDAVHDLSVWPSTPETYRFFVTGTSGDERIGIQLGQRIELQLTAGKDCLIETSEHRTVRLRPEPSTLAAFTQQPVWVEDTDATSDQYKFTVFANKAGKTTLTATDRAGTTKASLQVVAGNFDYDPDMQADLIADICRGSESFKILALQQMLHSVFVGWGDANHTTISISNNQSIFSQQATPNISSDPKVLNMTCGIVARYRAEQVFPKVLAPTADWYRVGAIHEPVSSRITDRKQVKYRPERVEALRGQIVRALTDGNAVRVGVLDDPVKAGMAPENGNLVAYRAGGHTLLIVGCSKNGQEFLYIDPWTGGSMMEYKGGIAGNAFPGQCVQIGKLIVAHDPDRRVAPTGGANNIIRTHIDTQALFRYDNNSYLEVVSAPFPVPGRHS
jgi:hypothetical protein